MQPVKLASPPPPTPLAARVLTRGLTPCLTLCLTLCLTAALASEPSKSHAFSVTVHRFVTERALRGTIKPGQMSGLPPESLLKFWVWVGEAMAHAEPSDMDHDAERFIQHFPRPEMFNANNIRALLGLNYDGKQRISGLDSVEKVDAADRILAHVDLSAQPDLDGRNQNRLFLNVKGEPRTLKLDGRLAPFDPMTLNMGEATGLSSQAHAHYQLAADHPSSDPAVLQKEPWNFVLAIGYPGSGDSKGKVETYGAWMAQMHLDVATLAEFWGQKVGMTSAGEPLQVAWLAAGLHYVEDTSGPLHNVQVGSYELFKRAKLAYWLAAAQTCGGYCGELPTFAQIGLRYLHNHHLMAEAWLEEQIMQVQLGKPAHPEIQKAWDQMGEDDPELIAALGDKMKPFAGGPLRPAPWEDGRGQASVLVETLAQLGSRDGAALYEAALLAGAPTLTDLGTDLPDDGGWRPWYLGDATKPEVQTAIDTMARIHAKSLRRAATAVRIYYHALETASIDGAARRLRRTTLDLADAAAKRRDDYGQNPPPVSTGPTRDVPFLIGDIAVFLVLLALVRWGVRAVDRRLTARKAAS